MSILPDHLTHRAYFATNGEMAWPWDDLSEVIEAYRKAGVAVLGVEAWLIDGRGNWTGVIPAREGDTDFVYVVDAPEREDGEDAQSYADRAASLLSGELAKDPPSVYFRDDLIPSIRYCVTPERDS